MVAILCNRCADERTRDAPSCNFRSKLYRHFILPNIGKPSKLKVVPKKYGNVEQDDWDKFVEHTLSDQFKGLSESAKISRAKHKYPHRLG